MREVEMKEGGEEKIGKEAESPLKNMQRSRFSMSMSNNKIISIMDSDIYDVDKDKKEDINVK